MNGTFQGHVNKWCSDIRILGAGRHQSAGEHLEKTQSVLLTSSAP